MGRIFLPAQAKSYSDSILNKKAGLELEVRLKQYSTCFVSTKP
jgi:hypothetical protein